MNQKITLIREKKYLLQNLNSCCFTCMYMHSVTIGVYSIKRAKLNERKWLGEVPKAGLKTRENNGGCPVFGGCERSERLTLSLSLNHVKPQMILRHANYLAEELKKKVADLKADTEELKLILWISIITVGAVNFRTVNIKVTRKKEGK